MPLPYCHCEELAKRATKQSLKSRDCFASSFHSEARNDSRRGSEARNDSRKGLEARNDSEGELLDLTFDIWICPAPRGVLGTPNPTWFGVSFDI